MTRQQKIRLAIALFAAVVVVGSVITAIVRSGSGSDVGDTASSTSNTALSEGVAERLDAQLETVVNEEYGFSVGFFKNTTSYSSEVDTDGIKSEIDVIKGESLDHAGLFIVTNVDNPSQFDDGLLEVLLSNQFQGLISQGVENSEGRTRQYEINGVADLVQTFEIDADLKSDSSLASDVRTKVSTMEIREGLFLSWIISSHDMTVWDAIVNSLEVSS